MDIASGQRREVFEAKAAELGCTLEQLKEHYTKEVEADFVERTEKKLSDHEIYLKDTVLPELEQLIDDFEKDHFFHREPRSCDKNGIGVSSAKS